MAAPEEIVCTVCGAKNPEDLPRCRSCGARLDKLDRELSPQQLAERRYQQEGFEWKWVGIAFGIYFLLQAFFLALLPLILPAYDPQGLPGLGISMAVWFFGGLVVGVVSPGRTFLEPAVGALLAVVPTILWLMHIADVYQLSMLAYAVGGLISVFITLFGAFLGERIQMARSH